MLAYSIRRSIPDESRCFPIMIGDAPLNSGPSEVRNTLMKFVAGPERDLSIAADNAAVGCGVCTEHAKVGVTQPVLKGSADVTHQGYGKVSKTNMSSQIEGLKTVVKQFLAGQ
jgi:hypothetical protein